MKNKKLGKFLTGLILLSLLLFLNTSLRVNAADADTSQTPVGATFHFPWSENADLAGLVKQIYLIALGLIGAVAVGMIVFGGIQYAASSGNPSKQNDARDRIAQAIWGVVLLLCAYLILNTINPELVKLKNPQMEQIKAAPETKYYEAELYDSETAVKPWSPIGKNYKVVYDYSGTFNYLATYGGAFDKNKAYILINKREHKLYIMDRSTNKPYEIEGHPLWAQVVNFGAKDGCANGKTGCNAMGTGVEGDKTTPVGDFSINYIRKGSPPRGPSNKGDAVISNDGKYNLGAAAIYLNVPNRSGIAIHGSELDTNGTTLGCVRMHNKDVLLLAQKVGPGMLVRIQNK